MIRKILNEKQNYDFISNLINPMLHNLYEKMEWNFSIHIKRVLLNFGCIKI